MNDSADIKTATARLEQSLRSLEESLGPMAVRMDSLEQAAKDAESFKTDRAELASQLDEAKSKEAHYAAKEAEFNTLADATKQELDAVISQFEHALTRGER